MNQQSEGLWCSSIIRATIVQLSPSCHFLVELDRAFQPSESRNFLERLASFAKDEAMNPFGIFFRYLVIGQNGSATKILLSYGGIFNSPNREMANSKARHVRGSRNNAARSVTKKTRPNEEPSMEEVIRSLRILLANCCISVPDGSIPVRPDRQYDKLQLQIPAGLFPSGSFHWRAPAEKALMAKTAVRPPRRLGHP